LNNLFETREKITFFLNYWKNTRKDRRHFIALASLEWGGRYGDWIQFPVMVSVTRVFRIYCAIERRTGSELSKLHL